MVGVGTIVVRQIKNIFEDGGRLAPTSHIIGASELQENEYSRSMDRLAILSISLALGSNSNFPLSPNLSSSSKFSNLHRFQNMKDPKFLALVFVSQ